MNRKLSSLLVLALIFIFAGGILARQSVSAETSDFNQKILPLDCVFEVINAGTGDLYYVTPEECGVIVQPYEPPTTTKPTEKKGSKKNAPSEPADKPILLKSSPFISIPSKPDKQPQPTIQKPTIKVHQLEKSNGFSADKPYSLSVRKKGNYYFRLPDSSSAKAKEKLWHIKIHDVSEGQVEFTLPSESKTVKLKVGQSVQDDLDQDRQPDIEIRVDKINSDGRAVLSLWSLISKTVPSGAGGKSLSLAVKLALASFLLVSAVIYFAHWKTR